MSLFSALTASLAAGGLVFVGRVLGLGRRAALLAALLLGLSPSFWSQANIQRVYALNALLLVGALYLASVWWRKRSDRHLIGAVFVSALGACNHTYMGVLALALGMWVVAVEPGIWRRPHLWVRCLVAGVGGLLPYLYQPLRSRADPRLDWGNPETLAAWWAVVTRQEAWNRAWIEVPGDVLVIAADYLSGIGAEFLWVGGALGLVGLAAARARRWPLLLLTLAMAGNFVAMALHGSRSDLFIWHRYYIPTYVLVALLAGLGFQIFLERWRRWALVWFALPVALLIHGYGDFDRSRYRIAEDFSRTLLENLPPGAHLSASDDNILFVLIYLHLVEELRPDLNLILQGVGQAELQPLAFHPESEPLYFTHHPNWNVPELVVDPVGIAFRVRLEASVPESPSITKWTLDGENDPRVPKDYLTRNLIGHFHYMLGITHEHRDWLIAEREFAIAREAASTNDVLFYNLGLIYARNGLTDRSLASFERSAEINPRHIATRREVRATERVAEARRELERVRRIETRLASELQLGSFDSVKAHLQLAAALEVEGEHRAARGHRLLALELQSAASGGDS